MSTRAPASHLRPLDPAVFPPDQPLAQPIYDAAGQVIVRKGERLSAEQVTRLGEQGAYVSDSLAARASAADSTDTELCRVSPEELIQALGRRQPPQTRGQVSVRQSARHPWRVRVQLTVVEPSAEGERHLELQVETRDISRTGFSFVCERYMHPGTIVYLHVQKPVCRSVKGIVKNCVHVEGRQHRAGVAFA